MRSNQRGFSFFELLVVLVILSIVFTLTLPKFNTAVSTAGRQSAARTTAAFLAQAKALAIENGRTTRFARSGNVISIVVDNGDGTSTLTTQRDLGATEGVTLSTSPSDTIRFDPRGLLVGSIAVPPSVLITRADQTDTVCVIGLAKISVNRCQLVQ